MNNHLMIFENPEFGSCTLHPESTATRGLCGKDVCIQPWLQQPAE